VSGLRLDVDQNEHLPEGGSEVDAILVVSVEDGLAASPGPPAATVIMLDVSGSMGRPPGKLAAARAATGSVVDTLLDGTRFAIVAGNHQAHLVYPPASEDGSADLPLVTAQTRAQAKRALEGLRAAGGTAMSTWLARTRALLETAPGVRYGVLLTDGKNESEPPAALDAELNRCEGRFQIQCFGVGTDWDITQLRRISDRLLGATEYILRPWDIGAKLERIAARVMSLRVPSAFLRVETPTGVELRLLTQVLPGILDLTGKATRQQEDEAGRWQTVTDPNPERPLRSVFPLGALAPARPHKYHLRLALPLGTVGEEIRAARLEVLAGADVVARGRVIARWTDDLERSSPHPQVAGITRAIDLSNSLERMLNAKRTGALRGSRTSAARPGIRRRRWTTRS
jgi:hypothetical protein